MDLATMRTRCATRFRDPSNNVVTSSEWTSYINDAYDDVIAASPDWPFMEKFATSLVTVNANTKAVALPTNVYRVKSVVANVDRTVLRQIYPVDDSDNTTITGTPEWYYVAGNTLYVTPTPTTNTAYDIRYMVRPTALSSDGDVPVFPSEYHGILVEGALTRAYIDDGADNQAQLHLSIMTNKLDNMKTSLLTRPHSGAYGRIRDTWFD